VLLPSDTRRKRLTSITAVLLPFVAHTLTLPSICRRGFTIAYLCMFFVGAGVKRRPRRVIRQVQDRKDTGEKAGGKETCVTNREASH
jgi:hypothetical protein